MLETEYGNNLSVFVSNGKINKDILSYLNKEAFINTI